MPQVFLQFAYLVMREMVIFGVMAEVMKTLFHFFFANTSASATLAQVPAKDILHLVNFMIGKTAAHAKFVKRLPKFVF